MVTPSTPADSTVPSWRLHESQSVARSAHPQTSHTGLVPALIAREASEGDAISTSAYRVITPAPIGSAGTARVAWRV
jgi:hypothetical protein